VAAELPQSKDRGLADEMDNIDKAQQIAALKRRTRGTGQLGKKQFFQSLIYSEKQN